MSFDVTFSLVFSRSLRAVPSFLPWREEREDREEESEVEELVDIAVYSGKYATLCLGAPYCDAEKRDLVALWSAPVESSAKRFGLHSWLAYCAAARILDLHLIRSPIL